MTFRNRKICVGHHSTKRARADPGRVGRIEQAEEPSGNSAPRSGPQLDLSRRQLKTWSKSKPSAALVRGPTYWYIYLMLGSDSWNLLKTGDRCSTQLAKMSIDPKFVELTADVVIIISSMNYRCTTQLAKLSFNHSIGRTHSWRVSFFSSNPVGLGLIGLGPVPICTASTYVYWLRGRPGCRYFTIYVRPTISPH